MGRERRADPGDRLHARARRDAGLHRRARGRRPRRDARRDGRPRRRRRQDQPARPRRARDRPLGAGRRLRHPRGLRHQRRARVRAQRGALRLPALGPGRLRQLRRRPAGHRDRPPGQPRVPRARGLHQRRDGPRGPRAGLPRHAGRDGLAHDDDQRPRRARLGRRRHRGRGRDARPGDVDAAAAGARLQAVGRAARGRDRHRPRADRDPDAARARRRGDVRRVLRPRRRRAAAGRPGHDRQHVAGVRLDLRDLPDRRRDAALPRVLRPAEGARGARRGLRQGAGPVARRGLRGADLLGHARARPGRRRAVARRPQAPAGPRLADGVQGRLPARARGPAARRRRGPEGGQARPGRGERRLLPVLGPARLGRLQRAGRALARPPAGRRRHRRPPGRRAHRGVGARSRSRTAPRPSSTTATS